MIWFHSVLNTLALSILTLLVSSALGIFTSVTAWKSNNKIAFYAPLLTLAVPPWLLSYYLSDGITLHPWIGATLSLGICCSIYFHTLIISGLSNTAYKNYEMLKVINGAGFKTLYLSVYPSIRNAFLPAASLVFAEVLTDFGVSNFFGINTITMVAYNVWTSSWNYLNIVPGLLLLFGFSLLVVARDNSFVQGSPDGRNSNSHFVLSLAPTLTLLAFSVFKSFQWSSGQAFDVELEPILNSLYLVVLVVGMCLLVSILFILDFKKKLLTRAGLFCYGLPNTVIASLFLLVPLPLAFMLPLAFLFRYFGLAINSLRVAEASSMRLLEVMKVFASNKRDIFKFKLKSYKQVLSIGLCLVALDVLRELPISMVLQPLNFSTLAMRMNYIARVEDFSQLGWYSFSILIFGLILSTSVVILNVKK